MWRLFVAWAQAHMLWHMATRPEADPTPAPEPPRPLDVGDMWLRKLVISILGSSYLNLNNDW